MWTTLLRYSSTTQADFPAVISVQRRSTGGQDGPLVQEQEVLLGLFEAARDAFMKRAERIKYDDTQMRVKHGLSINARTEHSARRCESRRRWSWSAAVHAVRLANVRNEYPASRLALRRYIPPSPSRRRTRLITPAIRSQLSVSRWSCRRPDRVIA